MPKRRVLFVSIILSAAAGFCAFAQTPSLRVPNAKHLSGLSASPIGHSVLFYSSTVKNPSDGFTRGKPALAKFGSAEPIQFVSLPSKKEGLGIIAWSHDGNTAYLQTGNDVYHLDIAANTTSLLINGETVGLALSPDGSRLALWEPTLQLPQYFSWRVNREGVLVVLDIASMQTLWTWEMSAGFGDNDLEFSSDGNSVYARTCCQSSWIMEGEGRSDLKRFDLKESSGHRIAKDCVAVTSGNGQVYFVAYEEKTSALYRIASRDAAPEKLISPFPFDGLQSSGTQRWIVAGGRGKKIAILDSKTHKLSDVDPSCENATVLPDGSVVCSRGAELFISGHLSQ